MLTEATPTVQATPFYAWSESKFYRCVLSVTWRYGRKLCDLGVLRPDGFVDSKAVYLSDEASIQKHRAALERYRRTQQEAKHNL